MASIYTHNRFGLLLKNNLSESYQKLIENYQDLYLLGQQGPDIFFFNLKTTMKKGSPGMVIHGQSGKQYLDNIKQMLKKHPKDTAYAAYFLGSLCHYILDSKIHKTVEELKTENYTHLDIETELDRFYIIKDGYKGVDFHLEDLIPQTKQVYEIVPSFYENYEGASSKVVVDGIKGFSKIKKLFHAETAFKEKALFSILKLIGKEKKFSGLLMRLKPFEESLKSNEILDKIFEDTLKIAPKLIESAFSYVYDDGILIDDFKINYDGIML